ncbi:2-oxoacid:acceptor oxidoreductase, alpha subunit [Thermodesulfobium narugense DSM 14796]|uniref:2-oxoacid:acceptor oxidoreductase, alpha subunit n=1 Tax=Thermodesulfobium narugense DSM 14796 TaxID=747365 RepID=M1E5W3_9BACT|nr:2-oxoacid:acceptor oxidoreductase subunit alpha [Thermodesulfobium narugense]AEE14521.1 2-oxoacid:acceptor oxidoreductase, alpha subunit [Thermodesulfobium narugense DSM 14796]
MNYTIRICGEAGQGIQTTGEGFSRLFSLLGYNVFSFQDYESRIRGGHNFYQITFGTDEIYAPKKFLDLLLTFDKKGLEYKNLLRDDGIAIYDADYLKKSEHDEKFINCPFRQLLNNARLKSIFENVVSFALVANILSIDRKYVYKVIYDIFAGKPEDIIEQNIKAVDIGYDFDVKRKVNLPASDSEEKILLDGVKGVGIGAIGSGCKFYSAYPMTPSTGVFQYIGTHAEKFNIVVEQAEDELSAINMAIGASFAGVRAMTGTSGGGFALMNEALSLSGMTETPIVILLSQRPGPATGFPTRTEQGELLYAIHAGHGDFPRVVFAPGDPLECVYLTNKAFDIAEKYQIPAIVLTDQHLVDSLYSYKKDLKLKLKNKDYRLRSADFENYQDYKRHKFLDFTKKIPLIPLAVPGNSRQLVFTDSDEHDEYGHITEDGEVRKRMVERRYFWKIENIRNEISLPKIYGNSDSKIVLIGFGSNLGVLKEIANNKEISVCAIHFSELFPLPLKENSNEFLKIISRSNLTICIENNASGQFQKLVESEYGFKFSHNLRKYDGRPFNYDEVLEDIYAIL